ncbi:MAG: hypothetical protein WAU27_02215 [Pseudomonadales bacterium]
MSSDTPRRVKRFVDGPLLGAPQIVEELCALVRKTVAMVALIH